jgi:hypothetical protein
LTGGAQQRFSGCFQQRFSGCFQQQWPFALN